MSMKVLVTGGAGFIGSHLVKLLQDQGHSILIVDDLSTGHKENVPNSVDFHQFNLNQAKQLNDLIAQAKPDAVVHLAAQKSVTASVDNPVFDAEQNILGSLNLLEACREHGVKKIVFASTGGAIYGAAEVIPTPEDSPTFPESPYGIAKLAIEHYLRFYRQIHGLDTVVLRLANVYGPGQDPKSEAGVAAIFCQKLLDGQAPTVFGNGLQKRDYVYVGDVARAFAKALEIKSEQPINIGTGQEKTVLDLIDGLAQYKAWAGKPDFAPARAGELLRSCLAIERAKKLLDWQPEVDLTTGLTQTVKSFDKK